MLSQFFQISLFIFFSIIFSCLRLSATTIPSPEGRIYFRVQGDIKKPNRGDHALFDEASFKKLPMAEVVHTQPSSILTVAGVKGGDLKYKGVLLETILDTAQSESSFVRVMGIDDQALGFSMAEVKKWHPLLAWEVNEKPFHSMGGGLGEIVLVFPENARIHNAEIAPLGGIYKIIVEPHTEAEQAA